MWNYYREELDNVYDNASDGKPFKYMAKITGKTEERPAQGQNEGCNNQPPSRKCNILVKHGKLWRSEGLTNTQLNKRKSAEKKQDWKNIKNN